MSPGKIHEEYSYLRVLYLAQLEFGGHGKSQTWCYARKSQGGYHGVTGVMEYTARSTVHHTAGSGGNIFGKKIASSRRFVFICK